MGNSKKNRTEERDRGALICELRSAADSAARTILPYFRHAMKIENKHPNAADFDPVTLADREAEKIIRQTILARYPNDTLIGEEFDNVVGSSDYSWVIDPIDGTRAFVCGIPTWAILIGVCKHSQPLLGIMSQPVVGDIFIGGMGEGQLISRSGSAALGTCEVDSLSDASLFATTPDMFDASELDVFDAVSEKVKMTRFGVDSYAYCLLAAGHVELVIEAGLGFYDIAALIPIIESAGGVVSDWSGAPVRSGGRVIAAANEAIHAQALEIIKTRLAAGHG
ncbi:MAG: inositol monophosphatase family protein [Pseudomonadota bacterium]